MRKVLYLIVASLALIACKKDGETSYPHADWVTDSYEKSHEEQTFNVHVTSYNVDWEIKPLVDWMVFDTLKGNETATIALTIKANTSIDPREGKAAVVCVIDGVTKSDTLTIKQDGEPLTVSFSPSLLKMSADAGSGQVKLQFNKAYVIENIADYPWLSVTESPSTYLIEEKEITVTCQANTAKEYRRADLRFVMQDTTLTSVLTVYQFGTGSLTSDSLALVNIYNSCGGPNWTRNNWDFNKPLSQWPGVKVEETIEGMRVTSLELNNTGLTGNIPGDVFDLSYLKNLWLGENNLIGGIPSDISRLQEVEYLYLYKNNLTGNIPQSIGEMTSLLRLHLYDNMLDGPIPESFGNLTNLIALGMLNNNLTGTLPASVGSLPNLEELYLSGNRFTGVIPSTYGDNSYYFNWEVEVNICPQQEGYGFDNCGE